MLSTTLHRLRKASEGSVKRPWRTSMRAQSPSESLARTASASSKATLESVDVLLGASVVALGVL
jgi:hypothetical protein